jgi:2-hydroxy-3-keto-5-methylthiopentenyl-1-phosphate phosphatase
MLGTVCVDFDGTIAPADPTDALFDRFCEPSWREIEQEWQEGRCTARACMAKQVDLIRATPEAIDEMLATVAIDPQFPAFVELCRRWDMRVVVVSDGLDRVVGSVLRVTGMDLPYFANRLAWLGGDRWQLAFPFARKSCAAALGNCKCSHRAGGRQRRLEIMVGDGRSDFCIAESSDLVLAKGRLASHCKAKKVPHWRIAGFADAIPFLAGWLARNARKSA